MGHASSKLRKSPRNPLEELQIQETKRAQRKRQQEKEVKQIAKLQQKHEKKHKSKRKKKKNSLKNIDKSGSFAKPTSATQRISCLNSQSTCYEINKEEFNRQIEQRIQQHLDSDLCTFMLNQVALTVQFLGNYESELANVSEELLQKENELNHNLEEHSILFSTPLDAAVNRWISYNPIHGPLKNNPQPLQPLAMYVVFENIDIARPNDANYDSISPLCKVDMDTDFYRTTPCKDDYIDMLREIKWKGFVRLKLREDPNPQRSSFCEDVYTDGSSGYSTTSTSSIKYPNFGSSGYSSELDCDYGYITQLNSHHPLSELKMSSQREMCQLQAKVLPDSCISTLAQFVPPNYDDDTEASESDSDQGSDVEDSNYTEPHTFYNSRHRYRDNETLEAIRLYKEEQERHKLLLQQNFLNSKEFMRYFGELVRLGLAERLYIADEELGAGTYRGSSIYTKHYELIPAIHVAHNAQHWPDCAFQFRIRERPLATNPLTGQQFQWPTRSMIRRIETFGYHVIPVGYAPKRQRNPFREIEWRIVFPKAERYLEQHLTNTQVKVFMMTKALVKTFVEPQEQNKALMFTIDHLRNHLFWECERNFTAWPEEFLGEVLLRFICSFMDCLREKRLKDFFIDERNLFESIPEYSLVTLYAILADIVANPLMHLMIAMRNLEFAENFFPKLNFKKLYDNLYENNMLKLKMQAKNSRSLLAAVDQENDSEQLVVMDEGAIGLVGMKLHREKTNGKLRRKTHLMRHNIAMQKKEEEKRRFSVESIDVEFFFTRNLKNSHSNEVNQGVENLRRTNILEVVLDQLLAMAEKAVLLQAVQLAKVYLAQAKRLCKFYHNYGCDMGAKEYLTSIHSIDEDIQALQMVEEFSLLPPALPIRTSVEPIKTLMTNDLEKLDKVRQNIRADVEWSMGAEIRNSRSTELKANETSLQESEKLIDNTISERIDKPMTNHRKSIKFKEHLIEVHKGDPNSIEKSESSITVDVLRFSDEEIDDNDRMRERSERIVERNHAILNENSSCEERKTLEKRSRSTVINEKSKTVMITLVTDQQEDKITKSKRKEVDAHMHDDTNDVTKPTSVNLPDEEKRTTAEEFPVDVSKAEEAKTSDRIGISGGLLKYTPLAQSHIFKDITTSTEKFIATMSSEETRSQIRDIIKRKTVQLKGAFNQSSET